MSDTIQDTLGVHPHDADGLKAHEVGPVICQLLSDIIRLSQTADADHQTTTSTQEFADWLDAQFHQHKAQILGLQLTRSHFFLNRQLVPLDTRATAETHVCRTTFLRLGINQITFKRGITAEEIRGLVQGLKRAEERGVLSPETLQQPHVELASLEHKDMDIPEVADERRKIIELYAGLLVKCSVYFQGLRRGEHPSSKHIKQLVQRICDEIGQNGDIFVGLINLRLIVGQDFVHAVNTSIYAMMLGSTIGLGRTDVLRCAITAITQDLGRMNETAEASEAFQTGDESHFKTNLRSVISVSRLGSGDALSALRLVTTYERGFPFNKPLPQAWYGEELRPHLLSRIVEISRHYDLLTQGSEGSAHTPDIALRKMMMKMGSFYDTHLLKLFVNIVGVYPVGSVVELSTGDRALVTQSPPVLTDDRISRAHQPVVRLLTSERLIDLSVPSNSGIRIVRVVEEGQLSERPGSLDLF